MHRRMQCAEKWSEAAAENYTQKFMEKIQEANKKRENKKPLDTDMGNANENELCAHT